MQPRNIGAVLAGCAAALAALCAHLSAEAWEQQRSRYRRTYLTPGMNTLPADATVADATDAVVTDSGPAATKYIDLEANEYIEAADHASLECGASMTVLIWDWHSSATHNAILFGKGINGWQVRVSISGGTTDRFATYWGGIGNIVYTTGDDYNSDSTWHAWVVTYNAGTILIYKNGTSKATTTAGTPPASIPDTTATMRLGDSAGQAHRVGWYAVWCGVVASSSQVSEISGTTVDLTATSLGQPTLWWKPDSDDTTGAGAVTDYGSAARNGTANSMEAADFTTGAFP